jgi:hypothetical protein
MKVRSLGSVFFIIMVTSNFSHAQKDCWHMQTSPFTNPICSHYQKFVSSEKPFLNNSCEEIEKVGLEEAKNWSRQNCNDQGRSVKIKFERARSDRKCENSKDVSFNVTCFGGIKPSKSAVSNCNIAHKEIQKEILENLEFGEGFWTDFNYEEFFSEGLQVRPRSCETSIKSIVASANKLNLELYRVYDKLTALEKAWGLSPYNSPPKEVIELKEKVFRLQAQLLKNAGESSKINDLKKSSDYKLNEAAKNVQILADEINNIEAKRAEYPKKILSLPGCEFGRFNKYDYGQGFSCICKENKCALSENGFKNGPRPAGIDVESAPTTEN